MKDWKDELAELSAKLKLSDSNFVESIDELINEEDGLCDTER